VVALAIIVIKPIARECTSVNGATASWQSTSTSNGSSSSASVCGTNP
jgi:polyribonucleotide nucleotidyltransferase